MEYEVQSARITTTGKLPDRFLNCQTKTTTDLTKAYMGTVYSLVEIISPWFSTAQVGQIILNTFSSAYYQGGSTSDLTNFEEALKKVNEALAEATQNGETNWIGNLNAILAVVIENKIHLAQTGKAEAYIFREGKINHLTYGLSQNQVETHPLKTFSNVTSGELKSQDKVIIANPDLFSEIDLETLREIITLHSPNEAILQIAKILKKKKVKTVNCLILDLLSLEEASKVPTTNLTDNIHLDRPIESFWAILERIWRQILKPIFHFTGRNVQKASVHSWQFTKNYLTKMKEKKAGETPRPKDLFDKEFLTENPNEEGLLKDEEIQYSPELNVHHYERQLAEKNNKWRPISNILNKIWAILKTFFVWFWQGLINKKTRAYFLIILAIIILVILGFVINAKRHSSKTKLTLLEAQNLLKGAEADQKNAESAALSGNQDQAKQLFYDCSQKAQQIVAMPVVKSGATETLEVCTTELDKLTAATRFTELSPLTTADKDTQAFFMGSSQFFFVTKDTIYKSAASGGTPSKLATLPRNNGDFQFGTLGNSTLYLYTSAQKIYALNIDTGKLELVNLNGTWETANAAAFYTGNLYLLDGILGQIYRHLSTQKGFDAGQNYISSGSINIKNSLSLAVDGSIYVLRQSGEVVELQKGQLQDFSLTGISLPQSKIDKPIKIYTDADTTSIYILDAGQRRVLEFDKNGHFIHQYVLPQNFNNLRDFTVSVKAKKIWVLNDNNLYEISI